VKRRNFIALLGGAAAAWPLASRAQQRGTPKVGVLMAGEESAPENRPRMAAFREGLAQLGWKDGDNVHVEYRWSAGKEDLIRQYAAELTALRLNVIVANSTPAVAALKAITTSIPIVCALVIDPVGLGFVQSLSRPGGNITGFTFINPELIGKWLALLKDVAPGTSSAALLFDPATSPVYYNFLRDMKAARRPDAIEIRPIPVANSEELATAINALARTQGNSLVIGPDPFNQVHIKEMAQLAMQNRLPAISVYRPFVKEGGLMAYGPDTADIFRRAASYVDRILKGAKPEDLPVQQPTQFEFMLNLKTANAFGLTVPLTVQAIADEVIE
jgi:putative tryptophan/tyrosine transport system substrate-binding protein